MQDDFRDLTEEEKKRKRHSLEMEIIMLDSDNKKLLAEKSTLEVDLRRLHQDEERLRLATDEKKKRLEILAREIAQTESEIQHAKKKLNFL